MGREPAERHLRHYIVGQMHVGRLRRGDPLPSVRAVSREMGIDHRRVATAYRVLEEEGLVEIRPGSGVYLTGDARAGSPASETVRWLGDTLMEGWSRGVPRGDVAALVDRCARTTVRCACVESNEDYMVAVAAELHADFGLTVEPLLVDPAASVSAISAQRLAAADLVVTTTFHAAPVRTAARRMRKPVVILRPNPEFSAEVGRRLAGREVTVVAADPRFRARGMAYLDVTPHRGRVRFVLVDELEGPEGEGVDLHGDDVLITRAARHRLGLPEYHVIPSPPRYISPESARELCDVVVDLALSGPAPPSWVDPGS